MVAVVLAVMARVRAVDLVVVPAATMVVWQPSQARHPEVPVFVVAIVVVRQVVLLVRAVVAPARLRRIWQGLPTKMAATVVWVCSLT